MKTINNRNGITLLELLIVIGIIAIIASAGYSVLFTGVRVFNKDVTYHTDQSALRQSMMKMEKEVRKASSATTSTAQVILNYTNPSSTKTYSVLNGKLYWGSTVISTDINAVSSVYNSTTKMLTITLTAKDGTTLSSQMHVD